MRVNEDYDDSEYDLNFIQLEFQYGNDMFQTTTNVYIQFRMNAQEVAMWYMVQATRDFTKEIEDHFTEVQTFGYGNIEQQENLKTIIRV